MVAWFTREQILRGCLYLGKISIEHQSGLFLGYTSWLHS
jgi:hypothetical protein